MKINSNAQRKGSILQGIIFFLLTFMLPQLLVLFLIIYIDTTFELSETDLYSRMALSLLPYLLTAYSELIALAITIILTVIIAFILFRKGKITAFKTLLILNGVGIILAIAIFIPTFTFLF